MSVPVSYLMNCIFAWFIVLLAIIGYFLTLRKMGERWPFWIILATGWALFAIPNTILIVGNGEATSFLFAVWLSSYILVMASLVLLFIRLAKIQQKN